ncbi:hypothetical protein NEUTE1DRAFT_98001 [Neurospora tetrasperma FGSC 2508]|uniref:Uncharacterized protein n=1 Tax=Neurospora tetrasperma (strain FGSC 2508 / ATCC MYA-4615 / P0657) TaxID=510951 RepID=F8MES2_NEUT8|nr:uncharacterized protein NEUTE1DRAFT_98001 [Neurospora tetrasperma FGSC 2508]EGO60846.1 hypothetical protein NEUTE1DRAFT_98001 [Neurospora tetrasperma FGSC 2508]
MCRRKEMQIEPRPSSSTTSVYRVRVGCLYRHSVCRYRCNTGLDNWMRSKERNENRDGGQGQAETGREQEVEVKFLRVVMCVDGNWVTISWFDGRRDTEDVQIQQGPKASGAAVAVGTKWGRAQLLQRGHGSSERRQT